MIMAKTEAKPVEPAPMAEPSLVTINRDVRASEAELQKRREELVRPFLKAVTDDELVGGEDIARRLAPAIYSLLKGAPLAGQKPKPLRPLPFKVA